MLQESISAADSAMAAAKMCHHGPNRSSSSTSNGKTSEMRISWTKDQITGSYVPLAKLPTNKK